VGNAWELRLSGTIPETSQLFVGEFGLWRRLRNNAVHFVDAALFAQSQWDQQPFVDALQLAAVLARCKDSFKDGTTTQPRGNTYGIALVQSPLAQPCLNLPLCHACMPQPCLNLPVCRACMHACMHATPGKHHHATAHICVLKVLHLRTPCFHFLCSTTSGTSKSRQWEMGEQHSFNATSQPRSLLACSLQLLLLTSREAARLRCCEVALNECCSPISHCRDDCAAHTH